MRPMTYRDVYDEDVAKRAWARECEKREIEQQRKYSSNQRQAINMTQSELAKRPDLWHAMPLYRY